MAKYYVFDPTDIIEQDEFETLEQAQIHAEFALDFCLDEDSGQWHDRTGDVEYGEIVGDERKPIARAVQTNVEPSEGEFDYTCSYELREVA